MKKIIHIIIEFGKKLAIGWDEDKPARLAAGLAYYSLFSLVPMIFIIFTIAGIFVDEVMVATQLFEKVNKVLGPEIVSLIEKSLVSLEGTTTSTGVIRSIIGILVLFFAASGFFVNLKYAINTIWHIPPKDYAGLMAFIFARLLAFVIVIGFGLLLVVMVFASLFISQLGAWFSFNRIITMLDQMSLLVVAVIVFAVFYKILPDTKIKWRDVWAGAIFAVALLAIGLWLVVTFLGGVNYSSATEAAGALAVMLIAVYYGAQIFLMGAEFTKIYTYRYGSRRDMESEESVNADIEKPIEKD
jgi:membrane protein